VVKDKKRLDLTLQFYLKLGFEYWTRSVEQWMGRTLNILKLKDRAGNVLEIIQGNWEPHVAITLTDFEGVPEKAICQRETEQAVSFIMVDPSGNFVEMVHEKKGGGKG
jgi:hypothetical protein